MLKEHGCDLIQPLAGQTHPRRHPAYGRGFLTRYSDRIRNEVGIATLVDGYLTTMNEINTAIAGGPRRPLRAHATHLAAALPG